MLILAINKVQAQGIPFNCQPSSGHALQLPTPEFS